MIVVVRLWGALGSHDERHRTESLLLPVLIFAAIWILNAKSEPTVIRFQMSLITLQNSPFYFYKLSLDLISWETSTELSEETAYLQL